MEPAPRRLVRRPDEGCRQHLRTQEMGAEDPLFILYTSGSTGKPKGVLHTTGGYLVYASLTHERVFDYRPGEVYWCTADIGWVTGHTYIVWPVGQRRHHHSVRGRTELPRRDPRGEDHRQAQGQHPLHRADRDPRDDGRRQGGGGRCRRFQPASARFGGRADQPGSLAVVLRDRRPVALPDRRHLVADRDRRLPDDPVAGRPCDEAGLRGQAVLRRGPGAGGQPRQPDRRRRRGQPGDPRLLAGPGADPVRRP